jgi:transposase InsO family protein
VFGRRIVAERVELEGWTVAKAAEAAGVSRQTATKWVQRYRTAGLAGLEDRSSAPRRMPRALPAEEVQRVIEARMTLRVGPHRLAPVLGMPRSTIGEILRRHGLSRLRDLDRATGIPIRYVRERPGELLHIDVKKLGRIPDGGGHRFRGRAGTPRAHAGYDVVHVAIDDATRVAYVAVRDDERAPTCARFLVEAAAWFARHGVRIERVMTDNAKNYTTGPVFAAAVRSIGAKHKLTRPWRPQTNGKAERFIQTMLMEWAYARPYPTNDARLNALPVWLDTYNHNRPHTSLDGLTPMQALVSNVNGNHI